MTAEATAVATALRDNLAEGDLAWIRDQFARGHLNFLRDHLSATDRIEFARHLAVGDLPWIRTVLSAVHYPGVGPLAGSLPPVPEPATWSDAELPVEQPFLAAAPILSSAPSALVSAGLAPPIGTPLPAPAAPPSLAARLDLPPPFDVESVPVSPEPTVANLSSTTETATPLSQVTATSAQFSVADTPPQSIDLGRPRRRWLWWLAGAAVLAIGAIALSQCGNDDSTTATNSSAVGGSSTVLPTVATTVQPPTVVSAVESTVATTAPIAAPTAAPTTAVPPPAPSAAAPVSSAPAAVPTTKAAPVPSSTAPAANGLKLVGSVQFNAGSSTLTNEAKRQLAGWVEQLKARQGELTLTAYADAQGSAQLNALLVKERNDSVRVELQRLGVGGTIKMVDGGVLRTGTNAENRRVDVSINA